MSEAYDDKSQIGGVRGFLRRLTRSGKFTAGLVVLLDLGLVFAYVEHGRGNLHKLKQRIATDRPETPVYRPGGQDPIVLTRSRMMGDSAPEFTSVTLLPGRGMNVLQITAFVPGRGEINLLASPSIEDAANAMTGTGADADGAASLAMGAAFEAPWADAGPGTVPMSWRGRTLGAGLPDAARAGGLLLGSASTESNIAALPDGGEADATFEVGKAGSGWPWKTQVKVAVLLSSKVMDMTITARNMGDSPEPVGLGWRPRFAADPENGPMRLRLPAEMRLAVDDGQPTGAMLPVAGTAYDFMARPGMRPSTPLNDCFTGFRQDLLDSGPVADLSFPTQDYGLRLTALTPTIKTMRVIVPVRADYAVLAPQFNYCDPFGREWSRTQDTGIVVLQPGQSTQWKVRLEIFAPAADSGGR